MKAVAGTFGVFIALLVVTSCVSTSDESNEFGADLEFTALSAPSEIDVSQNTTLGVHIELTNKGNINAYSPLGIIVAFFLSQDEQVTTDDMFIGMVNLPNVRDGIIPGLGYSFDLSFELPDNIPNGDFYIGAIVDPRSYTYEHLPEFIADAGHVDEMDESNNFSETYVLSISGSTDCFDDAYEPDDLISSAKNLELGTSQVHNFCFDTADWFTFDATAGNVYTISTSGSEQYANTYLALYDSDGDTLLATNGDDFSSDADLTWTAIESGTYYIKASNYDHDFVLVVSPGLNTGYTISLQ